MQGVPHWHSFFNAGKLVRIALYVNFPVPKEVLLILASIMTSFLNFCSHNPFIADIENIRDADLSKNDLIDLRTKEMM